jgi:predicted TPR repeat methyltransferase
MWMENITGTADQHRPSARPPPFTPSGDPVADRFYHRARQHAEAGDLPETAVLLLQALEIVPDFVSARFAFGVIREKLKGPGSGIVAALRNAEAAADNDPRGAGVRAVRLAVAVAGETTWQNYVRAMWRRSAAGRRGR